MSKFIDQIVDGLFEPLALKGKFCNVFGIVNAAIGAAIAGDTWDGVAGNRNQFADNDLNCNATFAGCTSAFVAPVRVVRAYVWLKNYKKGVATGVFGQTMYLQVATGAGGWVAGALDATTGTSVIAAQQMARATAAYYFNGVVPDNGLSYQAARVIVLPQPSAFQITDTASFDCNIDAT